MSAPERERVARAAWSALVEPGDAVAGALVAAFGPVEAWDRVVEALRASRDGRQAAAMVLHAGDGRLSGPPAEDGEMRHGDADVGRGTGREAHVRTDRDGHGRGDRGAGPLVGAGGSRHVVLDASGHDRSARAVSEIASDERPGRARLARALDRWAPRSATLDLDALLAAVDGLGGTFLVPGDAGWPTALDALGPTAPFGLWVRGAADLSSTGARGVAVVGARAATTYGERVAHDLAAGLAERGVVVVSGGAFGIDAAAHRGALARSGRTVVVLAGGVDRAYPRGNARLLEAVVADGGAVLSEVPVGASPTRVRFLQRNRLIAGLATATVVVEAAWRSGAISTAYHASALLRPVAAVPGPVTSVASAGCHRLLRSGVAVCVTDTAEVLELAGLDGPAADPLDVPCRLGDGLPEHVRRVLEAVPARRALEPGALAVAAGVSLAETHGALGLLELDGLVRRTGTGWLRARV